MSISEGNDKGDKVPKKPSPNFATKIAGEADNFVSDLTPYLPIDLVGGSVPYVPGTDNEAVWNATSQACATEKVHYTYTINGGRCWYLGAPSSSFSSNPDSWCPLAAALPGNSEFWDTETVYLYEQEGYASALRWDNQTGKMQLYIGASRTILPKIQSMEANFVTINDKIADIIPWQNKALRTELLSRATASILLGTGLVFNALCVIFLSFQFLLINNIDRDLDIVMEETQKATDELMIKSYGALTNEAVKHMVRIQELSDSLGTIDGTLAKYEVKRDGQVEWLALVPQAYRGGISTINGKIQEIPEKDGRARIKGNR